MDNKETEVTIMDKQVDEDSSVQSRRSFVANAGLAAGGVAALAAGVASTPAQAATAVAASRAVKKEVDGKMTTTVSLDWKEVYYTNCPLISASNVDQELGWTAEEFAKIGVEFSYFRSRPENDWYPH